jgi:RND family efflux transporter MFP subunit
MSFTKKISLLSLFGLFFFSACDEQAKETPIAKKEIKAMAVNVHTLSKQAYPIWVDFSGKTQASDEVMVLSRVSAEIQKRLFQAGDSVKKGDILFVLDKSKYQAIWEQKNAILQKNKASLALALANVKRYEPLVAESLAPKEKLDELQANQKQLEATIKADKASIAEAQLNLDYCNIKASISGQIGKELVLIGNLVEVGTALAKIVESKNLYVNFNPSAKEVTLIKKYKSTENPKVKVQLNHNNNMKIEVEGEIDFIDNVSDASTGTVAMRAKIDNSTQLLFPGSFVEIKLLVTDELSVLAVHPDQISQNQQGEYVIVINAENKSEERIVSTGYSNNELVIIQKGLKEGDKVLVGTLQKLLDGTSVIATEVPNPIKGK